MKQLARWFGWIPGAFKTMWDAGAFPAGLPTFYDSERIPSLEKRAETAEAARLTAVCECRELAFELETLRTEHHKLGDKMEDLSERLEKCHEDNEALHQRYKSMFS